MQQAAEERGGASWLVGGRPAPRRLRRRVGRRATSRSVQRRIVGRRATHITISNFMFSPMTDQVAPGATVSVTNKDSAHPHADGTRRTVQHRQHRPRTRPRRSRRPIKPGQYHYICNIHQYMMGTITVNRSACPLKSHLSRM